MLWIIQRKDCYYFMLHLLRWNLSHSQMKPVPFWILKLKTKNIIISQNLTFMLWVWLILSYLTYSCSVCSAFDNQFPFFILTKISRFNCCFLQVMKRKSKGTSSTMLIDKLSWRHCCSLFTGWACSPAGPSQRLSLRTCLVLSTFLKLVTGCPKF